MDRTFSRFRWLAVASLSIVLPNCATDPMARSTRYPAVMHVANAGILLSVDSTIVLIDALFDINVPAGLPPRLHDHLPPDLQRKLEHGEEPFGCANLILVTHGHDDHFTSDAVIEHLLHCPDAEVVIPNELVWRETDQIADEVRPRIHKVETSIDDIHRISAGPVDILPLALAHGTTDSPGIPHLGFLFKLDTLSVLVLGDATADTNNLDNLTKQHVTESDIAIVPHWWITSDPARHWLVDVISPAVVLPVHINAGNRADLIPQLERYTSEFARLIIFTELLETASL